MKVFRAKKVGSKGSWSSQYKLLEKRELHRKDSTDLQSVPLKQSPGSGVRKVTWRPGKEPPERINKKNSRHSNQARNSACSRQPD